MRIVDAGDCALSVQLDGGEDAVGLVAALADPLARHGVVEVVPGLSSVLVVFDPDQRPRDQLERDLRALAQSSSLGDAAPGRLWRIPVIYDGPDLDSAALALGMGVDELIRRHSSSTYRVRMLGFMPGFAYMDGLDPGLRLPRLAQPRVKVPAGSVAMADAMAAIYPWDSPGGWHLLGRTDVQLFDQSRDPPALLAPGDRVEFVAS